MSDQHAPLVDCVVLASPLTYALMGAVVALAVVLVAAALMKP